MKQTMSKHSDEDQFQATILTLFPEMFPTLGHSLAGTLLIKGCGRLSQSKSGGCSDKHKTVDDAPLGVVVGLS